MPAPKSNNPRRERVECVLTAPELARLDALRGHESRSHFLLMRAGVRVEPATAPACPGRETTP